MDMTSVDLIYADAKGIELGILPWAQGDFEIGSKNDYFLKIPPGYGIDQGSYLMADGTEYGGIVDGVTVNTQKDYIEVSGRTWHGLLATTIIRPDAGQSHLLLSGDLNVLLGTLIKRQGLDYCMAAAKEMSGMSVSDYQMERYVDAYTGMRAMLRSKRAKLHIAYDSALRKAVLSAVPRGEYVDDGIDGDAVDFIVEKTRPVNHYIGLGKGEGVARIVVDRYADEAGNVSSTQTIFGPLYKAEVYENTNSEQADLIKTIEKRLKDAQAKKSSCKLLGTGSGRYDIDDIVGGTSTKHRISVTTTIAKKIASIKGKRMKCETMTEMEV